MNRKLVWVAIAGLSIGVVLGALFFAQREPAAAVVQEKAEAIPSPVQETQQVDEVSLIRPSDTVADETYAVVKVVDGDTLAIHKDGKNVTIRVIGLDTPETVDPRKPVQCFGIEASNKAKELLTGTQVRIETDISQGELDKYDRLLAYVYLPDGRMFNHYMIAAGYGHEYTYNLPYKYQKEFQSAERAAEQAKSGLWADDACANSISPVATPWTAPRAASSGEYECSRNAYNCADFSTQADAQRVYDACGGTANDIHILDQDRDGSACETLP